MVEFNRSSLEHVYKLLEEEKFMEAIETYLHKDLNTTRDHPMIS